MSREVGLFGGAIGMKVPSGFSDLSSIRPVPDNQEVYVDPSTDQSIIVEIVQYQHEVSNENCAEFFFKELSETNDAKSIRIVDIETFNHDRTPTLPSSVTVQRLVGVHEVAKFRDRVRNEVRVVLVVVRLRDVESDILLTVNQPTVIHPNSASSRTSTVPKNLSEESSLEMSNIIISSFKINDWNLFS